jgi:hypothetical protein
MIGNDIGYRTLAHGPLLSRAGLFGFACGLCVRIHNYQTHNAELSLGVIACYGLLSLNQSP